jgi:hypothetical protein
VLALGVDLFVHRTRASLILLTETLNFEDANVIHMAVIPVSNSFKGGSSLVVIWNRLSSHRRQHPKRLMAGEGNTSSKLILKVGEAMLHLRTRT